MPSLVSKIKRRWWIPLKITVSKNNLHNRSADLVHLAFCIGCCYYLCGFLQTYPGYIYDDWDKPLEMYAPPTPVPRENIDNMAQLRDGITFVTAYFDLGIFKKGMSRDVYFGKHTYRKWMPAFSKFNNSVILFTDSMEIEVLFRNLRKQFPSYMTRIINIQQDNLWAFRLAPQIKRIYALSGYPNYKPNTVKEKYSCAMHFKYEALEIVIRRNLYNTKHLAWVDIGYFRDDETKLFTLEVPPDLKKDHIAYMMREPFQDGLLPQDIIGDNKVWIAGGMFLGQPDYLLTFIADYKRTVERLVADNLMSTDQQVLYVMYSTNTDTYVRARVPIQVYYHKCRCDWFYLGNICRYTWERKHWSHPPVSYFGALTL